MIWFTRLAKCKYRWLALHVLLRKTAKNLEKRTNLTDGIYQNKINGNKTNVTSFRAKREMGKY